MAKSAKRKTDDAVTTAADRPSKLPNRSAQVRDSDIAPRAYDLSFAKTGAALLPVTIATSRRLIAPMITLIGRPERANGTCVRAHVSSADAQGSSRRRQAARRS